MQTDEEEIWECSEEQQLSTVEQIESLQTQILNGEITIEHLVSLCEQHKKVQEDAKFNLMWGG